MSRCPRLGSVLAALALVGSGCATTDDPVGPDAGRDPITSVEPDPTSPRSAPSEPTEGGAEDAAVAAGDEAEGVDATVTWLLAAEDLANAVGAPRLLVHGTGGVVRVDGGAVVPLARDDDLAALGGDLRLGAARGDGTGLVVVEADAVDETGARTGVGLVRIDGDRPARLEIPAADAVVLHDLLVIDGVPQLLYSLFGGGPLEAGETGVLVRQDLVTGVRSRVAVAATTDRLLQRASAGGGQVALTYVLATTDRVVFVDRDGAPVDRPSPSDDLVAGAPPALTDAVLSRDGTEIASVEGPELVGPVADDEAGELVGDWQVVIDDADGEQLRLTVADQRVTRVGIDFDGRWLAVSGESAAGFLPPLLVDTEATDLAAYLVQGVVGDLSLETAARS